MNHTLLMHLTFMHEYELKEMYNNYGCLKYLYLCGHIIISYIFTLYRIVMYFVFYLYIIHLSFHFFSFHFLSFSTVTYQRIYELNCTTQKVKVENFCLSSLHGVVASENIQQSIPNQSISQYYITLIIITTICHEEEEVMHVLDYKKH